MKEPRAFASSPPRDGSKEIISYAGGWCVSQWAGDALLSNQQEVNQGSSGIASRQRQCVGCTRSAKCFLAHGKTSPNGHHGTDAGAWREIVHRFWQG